MDDDEIEYERTPLSPLDILLAWLLAAFLLLCVLVVPPLMGLLD